jgi:hypothetical protein
VDAAYSDVKLGEKLDEDATRFFWRAIEEKFDMPVTSTQRNALPTIGHVVHYVKVRLREEAKGRMRT